MADVNKDERPRLEKVLEAATAVMQLMVEQPELLRFEVIPKQEAVVLRVRGTKRQMGNLIGASGRNARSLRILIVAMLAQRNFAVTLDIGEVLPDDPSS